MSGDFLQLAEERGHHLPEASGIGFERYFRLLSAGNARANLTRITARREVYIKHFLDALELLHWNPCLRGPVLDVGSGAGVPGIPLKLARPELEMTLMDSARKKTDFLSDAVRALGLCGAKVINGRAEELGQKDIYRERFSLVVSRALARLDILLELCLPFVALGGRFAAYKGPGYIDEMAGAESALGELGGRLEEIWPYDLPEDMGQRVLLIFSKRGPIPARYPRRPGVPQRHPLGN